MVNALKLSFGSLMHQDSLQALWPLVDASAPLVLPTPELLLSLVQRSASEERQGRLGTRIERPNSAYPGRVSLTETRHRSLRGGLQSEPLTSNPMAVAEELESKCFC